MFDLDLSAVKMCLSSTEVYGNKWTEEQVRNFVSTLNVNKSISVICELLSLRTKCIKPQNVLFDIQCNIPFDSALKNLIISESNSQNDKITDQGKILLNPLNNSCKLITLQSLLLALKVIFAFGKFQPTNDYTKISNKDYYNVIKLSLYCMSMLDAEIFTKDHFIYGNYHLNEVPNIGSELVRAYYIYCIVSKDKSQFNEREYLDFNKDFENRYGYSIKEYLGVAFLMCERDIESLPVLSHTQIFKNIASAFDSTKCPEKCKAIIKNLSCPIKDIVDWAKTDPFSWWDFSNFFSFPVILLPNGSFASISDKTIVNSLYEKLYWHIRECYSKESDKFNKFLGKPFEKYIQAITEKAISKTTYNYIDEFTFSVSRRESNKKSSDCYILHKNTLISIEAKSFSPFFASTQYSDDSAITKSIEKLFINPVLESDKAFDKILTSNEKERFKDVSEVIIISVTVDAIQAVPDYYNKAIHKIEQEKLNKKSKYFINLSIRDFEYLLSMAENGIDIFKLIREYLDTKKLLPFYNFANKKTSHKPVRTEYMEKIYKQFAENVKRIIF